MKKRVLIIIVVIAVLILIAIIVGYSYCNNPDSQIIGGCAGVSLENRQECCDNWASENNILTIQCVGEWVIKDNQCAWECEENEEHPLIGGCAGVSLENRQECCDNWASENGIMHAQCVGEWEIKDNKCSWKCS